MDLVPPYKRIKHSDDGDGNVVLPEDKLQEEAINLVIKKLDKKKDYPKSWTNPDNEESTSDKRCEYNSLQHPEDLSGARLQNQHVKHQDSDNPCHEGVDGKQELHNGDKTEELVRQESSHEVTAQPSEGLKRKIHEVEDSEPTHYVSPETSLGKSGPVQPLSFQLDVSQDEEFLNEEEEDDLSSSEYPGTSQSPPQGYVVDLSTCEDEATTDQPELEEPDLDEKLYVEQVSSNWKELMEGDCPTQEDNDVDSVNAAWFVNAQQSGQFLGCLQDDGRSVDYGMSLAASASHIGQVLDRDLDDLETKPFVCDICNTAFLKQTSLNTHMKIHTNERPFKCETCGVSFSQKGILRKHRMIHTGVRPFKCDRCDASFIQRDNLKIHLRVHTGERPYKCDICGETFARVNTLQIHTRKHTGEKPYKCMYCPAAFSEGSGLKRHTTMHTGEKSYKCQECGGLFSRSSTLQNHMRIHTGEKPFKCNTCPSAFSDRSSLKRHLNIHQAERPFKCDECTSAFIQGCDLKRHKRRMHKPKIIPTDEEVVDNNNECSQDNKVPKFAGDPAVSNASISSNDITTNGISK